MTYDSAAWTGLTPRPRYRTFPHFMFVFVTPWFGIRIGTMIAQDAYGVVLSWGYVPPAPFVATHRHYRSWVWLTAEQLEDRL